MCKGQHMQGGCRRPHPTISTAVGLSFETASMCLRLPVLDRWVYAQPAGSQSSRQTCQLDARPVSPPGLVVGSHVHLALSLLLLNGGPAEPAVGSTDAAAVTLPTSTMEVVGCSAWLDASQGANC